MQEKLVLAGCVLAVLLFWWLASWKVFLVVMAAILVFFVWLCYYTIRTIPGYPDEDRGDEWEEYLSALCNDLPSSSASPQIPTNR